MTTIAPSKLELTCTVTGKKTVWLNKAIIQKKIDEFGSLEAFVAQYVSKGARKPTSSSADKKVESREERAATFGKSKLSVVSPASEGSTDEGAANALRYSNAQMEVNIVERNGISYTDRKFHHKDGTVTLVCAPTLHMRKQVHEVDSTRHAGSKALEAVSNK